MNAAGRLRELVAADALLRAPGVFDGMSAHVARRAGFHAVYLTGAGVSAFGFGLPDLGLVTQSEMVERARRVVEAAGVPVIADADTGFGGSRNVVRTVREYESVGVAAIQLEDQVFPKRCGHLPDKEVVSVDTFVRTLDAAVSARRDETVIVARTDARGPAGLDEALERARRYASVGADVVFVEAPQSVDEIEQIACSVEAPLLFNVVPGGSTPAIDDAALERLGFAVAIYPGALMFAAASAMVEAAAAFNGLPWEPVTSPAQMFDLVGMKWWLDNSA